MTDPVPYTAQQCGDVADALRTAALLDDWPTFDSDLLRLAATLRDYQRVLAENEELKAHEARWTETVERQRKAADRHREERAALEDEVAALRADAMRWRAVRDDLCLDLMTNPVQGVMRTFWRIDGNNYDYYPEPVPATVDEAADMIAARSGGEGD